MSNLLAILEEASMERAAEGFGALMSHVCRLYTCGESSSVSEREGYELAESTLYVLGLSDDTVQQTMALLSSDDVVRVWTRKRQELESRIPEAMELWQQVVSTMPPIRNIALRDTLASIGAFPASYDTFFAAHEIPCNIDYPLSKPVDERLKGLDYVEAWLAQLLVEARFLARFGVEDMEAYLGGWCPDYRGLLINLYDPIREARQAGEIPLRHFGE